MRKISTQERENQISQLCKGGIYSFVGWLNENVGEKSQIFINCEKHGEWLTTVKNFCAGRRCPKCAREYTGNVNKSNTEDFITKARVIHGDTYDYSETEYHLSNIRCRIVCKTHGSFKITPEKHLAGRGCPSCGRASRDNFKRDDFAKFTTKARKVHGNKYDYSKVKYIGSSLKISIACSKHGVFLQTPNSHLSGQGCPSCSKSGFDQTKPATLYAIRSDCGQYVKIGITNNFEQRFSQLRRVTPFDVSVIERIECDGQTARQFEKMFHDKFESAGFTGFDGATEWLQWSTELQYWLRLLK